MNWIKCLGVLAGFGAIGLTSADALSTTIVPGMSGIGWPNSAKACFQSGWAEMYNYCSSTQTLLISHPRHQETKTYGFYAWAKGNGTAYTTCKGIRNDYYNNAWFTSSVATNSTTATFLNLGSLYVELGNTIHFECSVAPTSGSNRGAVVSVTAN